VHSIFFTYSINAIWHGWMELCASLARVSDLAHGILTGGSPLTLSGLLGMSWSGEMVLWRRIWIGVIEKSKQGIYLRCLPTCECEQLNLG
jgi:hypothetical protein